MELELYAFNKRSKSTKRPDSGYTPASVDVQLKDRCTVENPVFIFDFEPLSINYIYCPKWDRYYFIADKTYIEGLWYVLCQEDYLASYKNGIINTDCMIMYSSGGYNNLVDARIPVKSNVTISEQSSGLTGINWMTSGNGTPMLAITGNGSNGIFRVDLSDMNELLDGFDSWYNDNIPDYFTAIKQLAYGGSAADNIKGAYALPFTVTNGGVYEFLNLGGYPCRKSNGTYIAGYRLIQYNQDANCNISIPWQYSDWRRSAPYSLVKIFLPLCGLFSINNEDIKNDGSLDVNYTFNRSSGDFSVTVKGHTSGNTVITSSGNCAMGLFVGSAGADIGKITTGVGGGFAAVIGGAAALMSGATGAAAVGAALAIGGGVATAAGATISGLGGLTDGSAGLSGGAAINMGTDVKVFVISKSLSDTPENIAAKMGKPVFRKGKAVNFGEGYFQADGFLYEDYHATSNEINQINNLVNTGIYIE